MKSSKRKKGLSILVLCAIVLEIIASPLSAVKAKAIEAVNDHLSYEEFMKLESLEKLKDQGLNLDDETRNQSKDFTISGNKSNLIPTGGKVVHPRYTDHEDFDKAKNIKDFKK